MNQETSLGMAVNISPSKMNLSEAANGIHANGFHEPTVEELERELPVVYDGQVSLGDLLSRVVQSIYAELSELAET
jgi:mediator of RNA polymerase II transcription subunit 14